jgi:integrase
MITCNTALSSLTRGAPFSLSALTDAYIACYQGRDPSITNRLAFIVQQLGHKTAHEIDADDVDDFLEALKKRGKLFNKGGNRPGGEIIATHKPLADATINRYRCTLQSVLSWGRRKRLMPKNWTNPVAETQRMPEDNARSRYLTELEYERLLKTSRVSSWPKLTLLIMLAVTTGARRGTLMNLRWKDVDLEAGRAICARTKNGEPFVLVLMADVLQELKRFSTKSNSEDLVFCGRYPTKPMNFNKTWETALADAQIEGVVFHTLRHTHASWLARRGAPLLAIADSLGHKSLAMTKRYAHLCVDSRAEMLNRIFNQSGVRI